MVTERFGLIIQMKTGLMFLESYLALVAAVAANLKINLNHPNRPAMRDSMKLEPVNCKCGKPVEVDYDSCIEFYGGTWQDVNVSCNDRCGYSVDITYNSDIDGQSEIATQLAVEAWNKQQALI